MGIDGEIVVFQSIADMGSVMLDLVVTPALVGIAVEDVDSAIRFRGALEILDVSGRIC